MTTAAAVVPLLLLALPLIDGLLVGTAHLRDHHADAMETGLPGRWRALGIPRTAKVIGLAFVQAGLAFLAVCVARTRTRTGSMPWRDTVRGCPVQKIMTTRY